jgi:hypothetical protein
VQHNNNKSTKTLALAGCFTFDIYEIRFCPSTACFTRRRGALPTVVAVVVAAAVPLVEGDA